MCGIAGMLSLGRGGVDPDALARMIRMVRHRGPDDMDVFADARAGLAHCRLSIIDLAGGRQPMRNEGGSLWITFNGEIFNYVELKEQLLRKGHKFATESDTEVILHLYEEDGEECVHRLNGQWAFAIWDSVKGKMFLSRDRLGVRPLFYTTAGGAFLFASEIKSLFAHEGVRREVDVRGLDEVFTFWSTIAPRTIFKGIQELPPGHSAVVEDGNIAVKQYWRLDFPPPGDAVGEGCEEKLADELIDLLADAVRLRLRADVPVGAYLSGGLDSTITTAVVRRFTDTPLKTFSVRFEDPEFDETAFQNEAVRCLGTEHEAICCTGQDIARVFPEVVWHAERPVLRTAPAPLFLLASLVRSRGYKVVLTGEGSDEIFGGYDIFKEAKIRRFWAAQPQSRLRPRLLRRLYPYLGKLQAQPDAFLEGFFRVRPEDVSGPFFAHLPRWELTSRLKLLFSDAVKAELTERSALAEMEERLPAGYAGWDWFSQAQFLETAYLLPGYILSSQGDRMAMAHSVEGRFPFLDYRVVEFASKLPPRLKMKVLNEKYLLKRAAAGLVPASVARRHKQPYRAPEGSSFFTIRNEYVEDLLSPERVRRTGLFHPGAIQRLAAKVRSGRAIGIKDNMALTGVLSAQLLVDQFLEDFGRKT